MQHLEFAKRGALGSRLEIPGRATRWIGLLAEWPAQFPTFAVRISYAVIAVQALLCTAAALTLVGLYGDGAWFAFAVADGDPWVLKWSMLASRASAYVTVVLPAELITSMFRLEGTEIAIIYGFLFSFLQLVQFTICVVIARRTFPSLLLFPAANYIFGNAFGFGFMSEALLGPGFFWIGFFLLVTRPASLYWFALCFAGLVFSHELMLPSAIMLAAFGYHRRRRFTNRHFDTLILPAICVLILTGWAAIRLSGGGADADQNALTTFDPRRIVNNPTLLMVAGVAVLFFLACRIWKLRFRLVSVLIGAVGLSTLPLLLRPWINFGLGRYDSARTLLGCELFVLGAWAVLAHIKASPPRRPCGYSILQTMAPMLLVAALAINFGSSVAFLWDWTITRQAFEHLARAETSLSTATAAPIFRPYDQARPLLTREQVVANDRMGFSWTWPFRSAMLAYNYHPRIIFYDPDALYYLCHVLRPDHRHDGAATTKMVEELRPLACSATPPPRRHRFFQRLFDDIKFIYDDLSTIRHVHRN